MPSVTRIKICGITNLDDARAALEAGANALGFIFVPDTPRYVGADPEAMRIPLLMPPFVSTVAVCRSPADLQGTPCDTIQFYSHDWLRPPRPDKRLIQAFRIRDKSSLKEIERALERGRPHGLLLDAYDPERLGGAGKPVDWQLAAEARSRFELPIILAGGLTPDNVADAIAAVRPYAVDVSTGVESAPGRKDPAKLKAFCDAVRAADLALDDAPQSP